VRTHASVRSASSNEQVEDIRECAAIGLEELRVHTSIARHGGEFSAFHVEDLAPKAPGGVDTADTAAIMGATDAFVAHRVCHSIFLWRSMS
jgi:hypothetical protein